jgi:NAD+ kinase
MTRRKRRVALLGHTRRAGVPRGAAKARQYLARLGCEVRVHEGLAEALGRKKEHSLADLARWCQFMVTLGGDGTALLGARALTGRAGALLPVNFGGLGFLTIAEERDLLPALRETLAGRWPVDRRRVVGAVVRRSGRALHRGHALNDVVIKGGYGAIHLRLHAMGTDLGHLVADGLIAASASGSTAYSLSAGGPVVAPDVEAMIVTPACAHSIASRSLVLPPGAVVGARLIHTIDRTLVLFDGQESVSLRRGDEVELRLERRRLRIVRNPDLPFTEALQKKLGWQGSLRRSM